MSSTLKNDKEDDRRLWERGNKEKQVGGLTMILASPIFLLFAYYGEGERGIAALICASNVTTAFYNRKERMHARWFWKTFLVLAIAHIPIIVFVPWKQTSGIFIFMFITLCFLDMLMVRTCIWLVERKVDRASGAPLPPEQPR